MRHPSLCALAAIIALIVLSGCKHHNAINFVTNTEFGVKVGVNAEKIPEAKIGYSRQEAARVPVYLMDGAMAKRTPGEVNALLNQAKPHLDAAIASVTTPATQKDSVQAAQKLISEAVQEDREAGKGKSSSRILGKMKEAADRLSADGVNAASRADLEMVKGMIAAERERPVFHTEFQEAGKFIGNKNGKDAHDAYSVIGTFKGNAGGGAGEQTNVKMGIAQYFATGVAAQVLAEQGGAALVSTAPNAKRELREVSFKKDDAGDAIRNYWQPVNAANQAALLNWIAGSPIQGSSIEDLIDADGAAFVNARTSAVGTLAVPIPAGGAGLPADQQHRLALRAYWRTVSAAATTQINRWLNSNGLGGIPIESFISGAAFEEERVEMVRALNIP